MKRVYLNATKDSYEPIKAIFDAFSKRIQDAGLDAKVIIYTPDSSFFGDVHGGEALSEFIGLTNLVADVLESIEKEGNDSHAVDSGKRESMANMLRYCHWTGRASFEENLKKALELTGTTLYHNFYGCSEGLILPFFIPSERYSLENTDQLPTAPQNELPGLSHREDM